MVSHQKWTRALWKLLGYDEERMNRLGVEVFISDPISMEVLKQFDGILPLARRVNGVWLHVQRAGQLLKQL